MIKKLENIILIILIIYPIFAQQGQVSIESGVDKNVITIGDHIKYHIIVKHNKEITVEQPGLGVNIGAFEIKDYKIFESQIDEDKIINNVEYVITTFDTGDYVIPPVTVYYYSSDSVKKALMTENINIRVNSTKPSDAKDIRDIKAPMEIKLDYKRYFYYGLLVLGIVIITASIFYYIRKEKGEKVLFQKEKSQ